MYDQDDNHWLLAKYEVLKLLGVRRLTVGVVLLRFTIFGGYNFYPRAYVVAFKEYLNGAKPTINRSKDFANTDTARQLAEQSKLFLQEAFLNVLGEKAGMSIAELAQLLNIVYRTALIYSQSGRFVLVETVSRTLFYDFQKIPEMAKWS